MHILLGIGNIDAFGIKGFFYFFGKITFYGPVIAGIDPGPDHKIHTAVREFKHGDLGGRILEYPFI